RHGDLRLRVDRQPGLRTTVLLPRAATAADAHRTRLCRAAVRPPERAAGESGGAAARDRDRAPHTRARPGARACGQRQPALAATFGSQLPGVRARAGPGAHLPGELRGAPRGAAARIARGACEAARTAVLRECAAARRARLRCGDGAVRDGLWAAVPRGRTAALRHSDDGDRNKRVCRGRRQLELPRATVDRIPQPLGGSLQQRLPAHPVAHRHRSRPVVRSRTRGLGAEAVLPSRGAHGFPVRGAGGGAGAPRRGAHPRAVPGARLAQLPHRAPRRGCRAEISRLHRRGLWPLDRHPDVHQHRRQHGGAPDEGTDAPADELRTLEPDRGTRVDRPAAARLSRGERQAAWLRHGAECAMSRPVLIMAGGTGGHVFPALALARLLRAQSLEVVWLGTERGLESRVIPAEGIPIEHLSVTGLRGKGALSWLAAPFRLARALWQALAIMRRYRPVVVVGLGGFVTGPGGVAAW